MTRASDDMAPRVTGWLRSHEAELQDDIAALARIPSHASEPDGIDRVARYVIDHLSPIDFAFEKRPQHRESVPASWLTEIFSPGVPYNALGGTYVGRRGAHHYPGLLLLADLDTAFAGPAFDRFQIRRAGNRLYGPGVADMKGGIVVMVAALRALAECGVATTSIEVVLAGDEQAGSLGSRPAIEEAAKRAAWCLCMECARNGGKLMAARGHIGVGRLLARGREAHAGSAYASGVNAIHALARLLVDVAEVGNPIRGILVSATIVSGGRRRSVIPAQAEAILDIRTPDQDAWARVTADLNAIVAAHREQGDDLELFVHSHRPGLTWSPATDELLMLAREAGARIGLELEAIASPAAGSSAFVAETNIPILDGMGPLGAALMTDEEHIELHSVVERAALLALVIQQLSAQHPAAEAALGRP